MPTINQNLKDRLFGFLFGNEANKAWTLSLYNTVNGTKYIPKEQRICRLKNTKDNKITKLPLYSIDWKN